MQVRCLGQNKQDVDSLIEVVIRICREVANAMLTVEYTNWIAKLLSLLHVKDYWLHEYARSVFFLQIHLRVMNYFGMLNVQCALVFIVKLEFDLGQEVLDLIRVRHLAVTRVVIHIILIW